MPGYNVEAPGAAYSNTLEDYLTRRSREAMAQQELNQRMQEMGLRAQIEQQNLEMRKQELVDRTRQRDYQTFAEQTSTMLPSDIPGSDYVERARKLGFGHLVPEAKPLPEAMPGVAALPLGPGGSPETAQPPGVNPPQPVRFAGLPAQRQEQQDIEAGRAELAQMNPTSPEARALRFTLATGYRKNLPTTALSPGGVGSDFRMYLTSIAPGGDISKLTADQIEEARKTWTVNSQQGARPYIAPLQTAEGIIGFNTRTGETTGRIADLKPGETAQAAIANAQSVAYQIGQLRDQFKPEFVGPLAGRYNSMQLALVGELGQSGLADFETAISRLGNTVIQLRTGAQMSAQEADRILKEVPGMNLPPDVFMARLQKADEYFQDWLKNRAKQAYGRTTAEDVNKMVGPKKPTAEKTPAKPTSGSPLDQPATGLPADWWQRMGGR